MGTNPTTSPVEELFLAGTFATLNAFTASEEDLLAGMETSKVRLRFLIDEAAKEPHAILVSWPEQVIMEPSEFAGGFQIDRQLGFDMENAWRKNKARSSRMGYKGSGKAMEYTYSVTDSTEERAYSVGRTSLREACERFTKGEHFPSDYKNRFGKVIRTAAEQANDWILIKEYLDQRSI